MNFFGMGPLEILVILVVALVIFGPGKLPEIAQTVGKTLREFKAATNDLTGEFQRTLNEVTSVTDDVRQTALDVQQTAQSAINGIGAPAVRMDQMQVPAAPMVSNPIMPPPLSGSYSGQRVPTKEDPLADLMPFDYAPPASNGHGGTSGVNGSAS